ncbi:MAG TPA: hypothetical protein VF226_07300 [Hyphomicrobiaceae bacterium]
MTDSTGYEMTFIREVVNAYGKPCEMLLMTISIRRARSRDRAAAAAIKRFERKCRLQRWDALAHTYRVKEINPGISPGAVLLPPTELEAA